MDWKNFFKPDVKKLVLAAIIFILIVPTSEMTTEYNCMAGTPCPSAPPIAYSFLFQYPSLGHAYFPYVYILAGLLSYLLSCAIVFAFGKLKWGKKSPK